MTEILIALAVVAAVGVLAGIMLALASHFFYVPENPTATAIREALPGVNCGACGYAGCDEYAKAVAEDGVAPNLCIPGAKDSAEQIAAILGVEIDEPVDLVAFVSCNGNNDATIFKAVYDGINTCSAASMYYAGPAACRFGCIGCGDCLEVCPSNAICIRGGIAHIHSQICIGCTLCSKTCPKGIIKMLPREAKVAVMCSSHDKGAVARKACERACIACGKCAKSCPEGAITVENNIARIDYSKCTGCKTCAEVCPTNCIRITDFFNGKIE